MIRCVDVLQEEISYIKEKFKANTELIDMEVIINLYINKTVAVIKCYYGVNYYGEKYKKINQSKTTNEYPRCSKIETQSYVVQYQKIITMRVNFIVKLFIILKEK